MEDERIKDIPYTGEYVIEGESKVWIGVSRAKGEKCERCWNYSLQVGSFDDHPSLCSRCYDVISEVEAPDAEYAAGGGGSQEKQALVQ